MTVDTNLTGFFIASGIYRCQALRTAAIFIFFVLQLYTPCQLGKQFRESHFESTTEAADYKEKTYNRK